jgi:hypothetical protein
VKREVEKVKVEQMYFYVLFSCLQRAIFLISRKVTKSVFQVSMSNIERALLSLGLLIHFLTSVSLLSVAMCLGPIRETYVHILHLTVCIFLFRM